MADEGLVQRVADELEVRNLLARLAQMADDGELDEYIQLFTEDAIWDGGANYGSKQGHAEILAGARARREGGTSGPGTHTRHVITTSTVTLSGDRAHARSVFHYYVNTDATPALVTLGIYEDEFARTERGWCMAHRKIQGPAPR
ncbi:nuclear transport factor 2 family protein [Myxococcota bacterium]|nr:nuclear transport factor 2 family protein [Myxococcota bacterium]